MTKILKRVVRWLYWKFGATNDPALFEALSNAREPRAATIGEFQMEMRTIIRGYAFETRETTAHRLLQVYAILNHEVGYLDGMACLAGHGSPDRAYVRDIAATEGKANALQAHDQECPGCDLGETLRSEVIPKEYN